MLMSSKEALVALIVQTFPYPEQITDWDFTSTNDFVVFTWRKSNRFRITLDLCVEEVEGRILSGSDIALLAKKLLYLGWMKLPK